MQLVAILIFNIEVFRAARDDALVQKFVIRGPIHILLLVDDSYQSSEVLSVDEMLLSYFFLIDHIRNITSGKVASIFLGHSSQLVLGIGEDLVHLADFGLVFIHFLLDQSADFHETLGTREEVVIPFEGQKVLANRHYVVKYEAYICHLESRLSNRRCRHSRGFAFRPYAALLQAGCPFSLGYHLEKEGRPGCRIGT